MMKVLLVSLLVGVCTANIVRRSYSCGSAAQFINTDDGEIESHSGFSAGHHYGKHMDCMWKIQAPTGMYVELTAESFAVEGSSLFSSGCHYDYLELFDGNSMTTKSMGKFCGRHFTPISSTQNFLTLHFVTDGTSQAEGFKFYYNFTNVIVHECSHGSFNCNNSKCVPNRYVCDNDDDCGDDSDEQGCASRTTSHHFHYPCSASQFTCNSTGTCLPMRWHCDGDTDCNDGSDEMHCSSFSTPFFFFPTTTTTAP